MKALIPILVSVVVFLSALPARAAETDKTPQENENQAEELVRKLGNPTFREREAASRELAKLGLGATKAIEEGRKNPDPEIRARCERLYPMIRTLELKRRIEELAADNEVPIANTLPLAATYEKICGIDENARKFYIELCKSQLQLLDAAVSDPEAMGEAYFDFTNELGKRGTGNVTEGAAMFLIGASEEIAPSIDEANRMQKRGDYQPLIGVLSQPRYQLEMIDANNGRCFRKLLFAWAKRNSDPRTMKVLLYYIQTQAPYLQSDPDTTAFVMDLAVSTSAQALPFQKGDAMVAVACISGNDQISYIEKKLLKDETTLLPEVAFDLDGPTKIRVETRVCDYALAICVKLSGQSFDDYGFDILGSRSDMFNNWEYAGFTKDETRKAAFKKYEEWRKANPIKQD